MAGVIAALEEISADVAVIDFHLPDGTGADAADYMRARSPSTAIVFLSADDSDDRLLAAIEAGASSYLLKPATGKEIVHAIRSAAIGKTLIPAGTITGVLARERENAREHARHAELLDSLTPREQEILSLLIHGADNATVAKQLNISYATVRTHVRSILAKLRAHSGLEAVAKATRWGFPRLTGALVMTVQAAIAVSTGSVLFFLIQFPLGNLVLAALFARTARTGMPLVAQLAAEIARLHQTALRHPGLDRFFQGVTWLWASLFFLMTAGFSVMMVTERLTLFLVLTTAVTVGTIIVGAGFSAVWFSAAIRKSGLRVRLSAFTCQEREEDMTSASHSTGLAAVVTAAVVIPTYNERESVAHTGPFGINDPLMFGSGLRAAGASRPRARARSIASWRWWTSSLS